MNEDAFLSALREDPGDEVTWLALADWLEDDCQAERAELIRHARRLRRLRLNRRSRERVQLSARVAELLAAGVRPTAPEITNGIGMRLALIPPGKFRMGSPSGERGRQSDEFAHEVTITRPFYLGVFAVTQAQFRRLHRRNPSHFSAGGTGRATVAGMSTEDFPVERVIWSEAVGFCEKLSARKDERAAKRVYRLPSEAEWEYACRGGSASTEAFHQGPTLTVAQANINSDSSDGDGAALGRTRPVGGFAPNAFGLYDMHGNVWEWCDDWYLDTHYQSREPRDPRGPASGHMRIIRGGSWGARWMHSRAARRHHCAPGDRIYGFGFRVAMTVSGQDQ